MTGILPSRYARWQAESAIEVTCAIAAHRETSTEADYWDHTGINQALGEFETSSLFDFLIEETQGGAPGLGNYTFTWTGEPGVHFAPGDSGVLTRQVIAGQTYTAEVLLNTVVDGAMESFRTDGTFNMTIKESVAAVPEPATLALLGLAVCGLGNYVQRRRKA